MAKKLEEIRSDIKNSIADGKLPTIRKKVAKLLADEKETRNSDIKLQLRYWEKYCEDVYQGGPINPHHYLNELPRLTSLSRERAYIQNTLDLYPSDKRIRKNRKALEEKNKNKDKHPQ